MSEMKKINDEQMNEIAGGKDYRVQNSNFCPRQAGKITGCRTATSARDAATPPMLSSIRKRTAQRSASARYAIRSTNTADTEHGFRQKPQKEKRLTPNTEPASFLGNRSLCGPVRRQGLPAPPGGTRSASSGQGWHRQNSSYRREARRRCRRRRPPHPECCSTSAGSQCQCRSRLPR